MQRRSAGKLPPIQLSEKKIPDTAPFENSMESAAHESLTPGEFRNHENSINSRRGNPLSGKKNGSLEILKNLNFSLNPHLHKRKKITEGTKNGSNNKRNTLVASSVTRNILELRDRTQKQNLSLALKPRLKQTRSFKNGSLSILQNTPEARNFMTKKYSGFVQTEKSTLTEKGRDKLRLQVVKWFLDHKNEIVQTLNDKKEQIVEWVTYVGHVNKAEFELIMDHIGIKRDRNLLNRLFWLFDLNSDETIDQNEIHYSINLFKEYTLEEKVQTFFELCDEDEDGFVTVEDLKRFFIKNLHSEEDIKVVKFVVKDFFRELNPKRHSYLTQEELYEAALTDPSVRTIVEKNTRILKQSKQEDYSLPLNFLIPQQETDNRSGIFFPYMDTLMKLLEDREKLVEQHTALKYDHTKHDKNKQVTKTVHSESESDEEDNF